MLGLGLRVPPGFVVTQAAYDAFVRTPGLGEHVREIAALGANVETRRDAAAELRAHIEATAIPEPTAEEILAAYDELAGLSRTVDVEVAVRSSASAEDLPGASFAGQQDTYLGVRRDGLLDSVRRCWASLFSERAVAYRTEMGYPLADVSIAVVVQKLVSARASGVMFTINPVTGNPFEIVIEANWGLGESVVSGLVVPDRFLLSKHGGAVQRELGEKMQAAVAGAGGHSLVDLPAERRAAFCLDDAELGELARLGRLIEDHYGEPRDVEWSVDEDLPFPESVLLLQMRPVTTTGLRDAHRDPGKNTTDHILDLILARRFGSPTASDSAG
jgi:pyruvate,water dikinase